MEEERIARSSADTASEVELHSQTEPSATSDEQVDYSPAQVIDNPSTGAVRGHAPIHFVGALVTVILDMVWGVPEVAETISGALPLVLLTSMVLGLICMVVVTLVQRFLARDGWVISIVKGVALGVVAAVPYPVVGTVVGVPLLAWAGIDEIRARESATRPR